MWRHGSFDISGVAGPTTCTLMTVDRRTLLSSFVGKTHPVGAVRLDNVENWRPVVRMVAIVPKRQQQGLERTITDAVEWPARTRHKKTSEVYAACEAVRFYGQAGWKNDRSQPAQPPHGHEPITPGAGRERLCQEQKNLGVRSNSP